MKTPAGEALYQSVERAFFQIFLESIFYGVFTVLFIASTYLLLRQGLYRTKINGFMFTVTAVMYLCASLAQALGVALLLKEAQADIDPTIATPAFLHMLDVISAVGFCVVRVNYILSDIVVVWRAWVIWGRERLVLCILGLFLSGSIAAVFVDAGLSMSELFQKSSNVNNASAFKAGERAMVLSLPALATNLAATGFIFARVWQHRKFIKSDLDERDTTDKVTTVLVWLIESSFVYCFVWILYILAYFQLFTRTGLFVMDSTMVQIVGIYPTLIIILVAVNKSQVDRYTTNHATNTLSFAANPVVTGNLTFNTLQASTEASSTTRYRLNTLKDASGSTLGETLDSKESSPVKLKP